MNHNQSTAAYGGNAYGGATVHTPARNFAYQDTSKANFLSEAITKGVLSARRSSATPFATSDNSYGPARSTVGKVINSQGQA